MQTGTRISAIGHGGLILWVFVGGVFFQTDPPAPLDLAEVTLITAAELDAFNAQSPGAVAAPDAPEQPIVHADPVQPVVQPDPVLPQQVARPADAPVLDLAPDLSALAPAPLPDIAPAPPAPPPVPDPVPETPVIPDPAPAPAPRVAPQAAPAPSRDATPDPVTREATSPDRSDEAVVEATEATAPEEAATEIVTQTATSRAPRRSVRPTARPKTATRPADASPADATNGGLADTTQTPPAPAVPLGPPLTRDERDGLRVAVERCWNTGALSSEALLVTVIVSVELTRDAKPIQGSLRMVSFSGGTEAAANRAYEVARRAILSCGMRTGFGLPEEKYAQWKTIEMTFNPEDMRLR